METVRTCTACRQKDDRGRLLRFVRALDGEICFDEKARLPSRGAWICAKRVCLTKAFDKCLLFRGEKTLPVKTELMIAMVTMRIKESVLSRFGLLRRMGHCEAGRDAVKSVIKDAKAVAVVYAADFAPRSVKEMTFAVDQAMSKVVLHGGPFKMSEMAKSLGREKTGVVALLKSRITEEILVQLSVLSELGVVE